MLPKKNRLDLRSKPYFFKEAKKKYSNFFTVYFQEDQNIEAKENPVDQVAIIARKKIFKKAVERHQMMRKARAAIMPLLKKRGIKAAVVLNKSVKEISVEELEKELQGFFSTLKK